jgi:hypothetical protein
MEQPLLIKRLALAPKCRSKSSSQSFARFWHFNGRAAFVFTSRAGKVQTMPARRSFLFVPKGFNTPHFRAVKKVLNP